MPKWAEFDEPALAKGFTSFPNLIFELELPTGPKLLYLALLRYAWQEKQTYPSQQRLARDVSAGRQTVIAWMKQIEQVGLISRLRREGQASIIRFRSLSDVLATRAGGGHVAADDTHLSPATTTPVALDDTKSTKTKTQEDIAGETPPATSASLENGQRHRACIDAYHQGFEKVTGEKPRITAADGRLLKETLRQYHGGEEWRKVLKVIEHGVTHQEHWIGGKPPSLKVLLSSTVFNGIIGKLAMDWRERHGEQV